MNPKHAAAIKDKYREALKLKVDTDKFDAMLAIRKRATKLGISTDEVTKLYTEVLSEKSKPAPPKELPHADEIKPAKPEPPKDIPNLGTRRGQQTVEPMHERKDSDSMILRMADEKRK